MLKCGKWAKANTIARCCAAVSLSLSLLAKPEVGKTGGIVSEGYFVWI